MRRLFVSEQSGIELFFRNLRSRLVTSRLFGTEGLAKATARHWWRPMRDRRLKIVAIQIRSLVLKAATLLGTHVLMHYTPQEIAIARVQRPVEPPQ